MLLVAGGSLDGHVTRIAAAAEALGVPHRVLRVGPNHHPRVTVELPSAALWIGGEGVSPSALWMRHDVFAGLADPRDAVRERAAVFYETIAGWAALRPDVRWVNRDASQRRVNKLAQLGLAAACGLRVPWTVVTNDPAALPDSPAVAKPVLGGRLCVPLEEALSALDADGLPQPAFVQERLGGPEVRVYLVGDEVFAWTIHTDHLDHRSDPDARVHAAQVPAEVIDGLRRLMTRLGLDLAAADLKRDPVDGGLVFLEINSQPMWSFYDEASGGALARAMVLHAVSPGGRSG